MPLAFWGNGSGDWSSTFASLAEGTIAEAERLGARLDARREEELAAKDEVFFARYQDGQVSDGEFLAYLRRREEQTGYDPQQQAVWRKTRIEWTERIEDDEAQADFERTGDFGDYINYWQAKLRRTKDSAGRLQIQQQIRAITDQRDHKVLAQGAQRINRQIALGQATHQDLLRFYRQQRSSLRSNSPLREQINEVITQTQVIVRQQAFDAGLARIDQRLLGGDMTPEQAGKAKLAMIRDFGLANSDPARYLAEVAEANKLRYSPSPAQLAELDYKLQSGQLTPDEYEAAYYKLADRLMDYDPASAWSLRSTALGNAAKARADVAANGIPYPEYLGPGTGGGGLRWISQMDGTQFEQTNCVMASGAMLAYAMGYTGLSGGDLRYLTGDTVGGTNLDQLMFAMKKAGVSTDGMNQFTGATFERFKKAVGNGRPAVLMGLNANLPAQARANPNHMAGHGLLIADYDEKKDAFLVYNSAVSRSDKRSKNGYWVNADAIQNFGWGPSYGGQSFNGQFVLAPKGTLKPGQRRAMHVIDVDTPPRRPQTPKTYVGRRNPGAAGHQQGAVRNKGGAKNPIPTTREEVNQRSQEGLQRIDQIEQVIAAGQLDDGTPLTPELISELDHEMVSLMEQEKTFNQALGEFGQAGTWRDRENAYITKVKERNGIGADILLNTYMRNMASAINDLQLDPDPRSRAEKLRALTAGFGAFAAANTAEDPKDPLSGVDDETEARIQAIRDGLEAASDPEVDLDTKAPDLARLIAAVGGSAPSDFRARAGEITEGSSRGDDIGKAIAGVAGIMEDWRLVEPPDGSEPMGEKVLVDGVVTVVPYKMERRTVQDPETGEGVSVQVPVLDVSKIPGGDGRPPEQMPVTIVPGPNGPVFVRTAVTERQVGTRLRLVGDVPDMLKKMKVAINKDDGFLTSAQIAQLSASQIDALVGAGVLREEPWMWETYVSPDYVDKSGRVRSGNVWYHEPGRGVNEGWHPTAPGFTTTVAGRDPANATYVGWDDAKMDADVDYQAGDNGFAFPWGGDIKGADIQRLVNQFGDKYRPPEGERTYRDENGQLVTDRPDLDDTHLVYDPRQAGLNELTTADDLGKWDDMKTQFNNTRMQAAKQAAQGAMDAARRAMEWQAGGGSVQQPEQGKPFDPTSLFETVRGLAEGMGVKPPAVNPVTGRKSLNDALNRPRTVPLSEAKAEQDRQARIPKPAPSRGRIPPPVNPADVMTVPKRNDRPSTGRKWTPPRPPAVDAAMKARNNAAKAAAARAAAERAKAAAEAAKRAVSGGYSGFRGF